MEKFNLNQNKTLKYNIYFNFFLRNELKMRTMFKVGRKGRTSHHI